MPWLRCLVTCVSPVDTGWILGHSMWDLWWTKWHWDKFFSEYFVFPRQYNSTIVPYASSCTFCSYEKDKRAELSKSNALLVIGVYRIKKYFSVIKGILPGHWILICLIDMDVFSFFISVRIPCRLTGYVSDLWMINYKLYARDHNRSLQDCGGSGRRDDYILCCSP